MTKLFVPLRPQSAQGITLVTEISLMRLQRRIFFSIPGDILPLQLLY
ncbi:hypothetical protein LRM35_22680 [Klebsiella variicola subsp. variicola]|nr:hypothetical protein LRM35_22680 [Klebsiella variicola subsp. variicola]